MKVVIIGGGFAGINVAKALKRTKDIEILLLDRTNHHLFQPLLYQVATASLSSSNIAFPLREIFQNQPNVTVFMEEIEKIETDKKEVKTADGKVFSYDFLIAAPGASHSYFGHDHWEEDAPGLKTLLDAARIRERLLLAFEKAERCEDPEEAKRYLNFAIIGAGPTGVEIAGSIAEFAHHTLRKNFRYINPAESKIYLIEGADQVLPSFPKALADKALKDLEQLGITVLLKTLVTQVSPQGISLGEQFLDIPTIIWAAGNQASPLLKTLKQPLDSQGRVKVNPDLSIEGHPNVFVIGDAASVKQPNDQNLPAIAPVAIQQARYIANVIKKRIQQEDRKPFVYFDKGMIATIGKGRAVATLRKLKFSGFSAWFIWSFIHVFYLISFKHRTIVLLQWLYLYFTGSRPDRIIKRPLHK